MFDVFSRGLYYSPDGGGNAGGSTEGSAPGGQNAGQQNAAGAKQYTQAELDALFSERATRAEQSTTKKLLESLGVEKIEDAQGMIANAKKQQEAQLSEMEKVKKAHAELETKHNTLLGEHTTLLRRTAFNSKASAMNLQFASAEAQADAFEKTDLSTWDGKDDKALEQAITATTKARPYLLKTTSAGSGQAPNIDGQGHGTNQPGQIDKAREQELRSRFRF